MLRQLIMRQDVRYVLVSAAVFAASQSMTFVLVRYVGFSVPDAWNILTVPVVASQFPCHKFWVFRNGAARWIRQPTLYGIIMVLTYGLSLFLQYSQRLLLGVSEWTALASAIVIVWLVRWASFRRLFST